MQKKKSSFLFHHKAQKKLLEGVKKLLPPCLSTYGKQKNLSSELFSEGKDPFQNLGLLIAKKALDQMQESCLDGKKTMLILLHVFLNYGLLQIKKGLHPLEIRKEILKLQNQFFHELEKAKQTISTSKEVQTLISHFPIEELEKDLLLEAFIQTQKKGPFFLIEADTEVTSLRFAKGIKIPYGYASPYFITNTERMCAELNAPKLFFLPKKVTLASELSLFLENSAASNKPILLLVNDLSGEALSTLVMNKLHNTSFLCALKEPSFFPEKKKVYRIIQKELSHTEIDKAYVFKDSSFFLGNFPSAQNLAIFSLGEKTPNKKKNKVASFKAYVNFLQFATKEGVIPGGITTFLRFAHLIKKENPAFSKSLSTSFEALCKKPLHQEKLFSSPLTYGYNLESSQIEDFSQKGPFDTVHTLKQAFSTALEFAFQILHASVLIT